MTEVYDDAFLKGRIMTVSGILIRPLAPDPADVRIGDIAHSLANLCRFTGHTRRFYSIAQHCVLVSRFLEELNCSPEIQLIGLLHDASEAYLSDIARPVKKYPGFKETYELFEGELEKCIAGVFGLEYPFPSVLKEADRALGLAESRDLMPPNFPMSTWEGRPEDSPYTHRVRPWWTHWGTRHAFLKRFKELT